jgi:hypothetical protein
MAPTDAATFLENLTYLEIPFREFYNIVHYGIEALARSPHWYTRLLDLAA